MAKRSRDYAAEYAARKSKARASGFSSEREYKAARREAREWSAAHSQVSTTKYSAKLTASQVQSYRDAWVRKPLGRGPGAERRHYDRMRDYLVTKTDTYTPAEFEARYGPRP